MSLLPHKVKKYFQPTGSDILTGGGFFNDTCSDASNPVYSAYRDWFQTSELKKSDAKPSWDLLTVYAAIVGTEKAEMYE